MSYPVYPHKDFFVVCLYAILNNLSGFDSATAYSLFIPSTISFHDTDGVPVPLTVRSLVTNP